MAKVINNDASVDRKDPLGFKPSELMRMLYRFVDLKQPAFIWGGPGIGKSEIVRSIANKRKIGFIDYRALLRDPVDICGIPYVDGGRTRWATPSFLPQDGEGIFFLDEFPLASLMVQGSLLQLTLDRTIGEAKIGDGWAIIAAGNRMTDRAGGNRLISTQTNRFVHFDLTVDADDWHDWAITEAISPIVTGYIKANPSSLYTFDPTIVQREFASPRSWSFVSKIIDHTDADLMQPVFSGCIGAGDAAKFCAYIRRYGKLPDIDLILKNPKTAPIPSISEPDIVWALATALTDRVRKSYAELRKAQKSQNTIDDMLRKIGEPVMNAVAIYGQRLQREFGMMMFIDCLNASVSEGRFNLIPEAQAWLSRDGAMLQKISKLST